MSQFAHGPAFPAAASNRHAATKRNLGRHRFALGCKAERRWPCFAVARKAKRRIVGAANPATAVDEGIEHQAEELMAKKVMPAVNAQISRSNQDFRAVSRDTDFRKTGT